MIERLSGDFNRGYTKAIRDIILVFEYEERDLKHFKKRYTSNLIFGLLECILWNREKIRDGWDGFIRWNCKTEEFEWYGKDNNDDITV